MDNYEGWKDERYIYEKLKQAKVFRYWKKAQFDCQRGRCAWCGKPMQYRYTETDHIVPLYYGGKSEASNLVLCHHKCNEDKSVSRGYARPEWITVNKYDEAVTGLYSKMVSELLQGEQSIQNTANSISEHNRPTGSNRNSRVKTNTISAVGMTKRWIAVGLVIFLPIVVLLKFFQQSSLNLPKTNNTTGGKTTGGAGNTSNKTTGRTGDADEDKKYYAQLIVAEYTNYYNNWVIGKGYKLPKDTTGCTDWKGGCTLSNYYAHAEVPSGYTYSVNSLEEGVEFAQNGQLPHALKDNYALYKKARCGANGSVIGGAEGKNAAVVVQLANGSYYCVQN